jgi:hypothetical protein
LTHQPRLDLDACGVGDDAGQAPGNRASVRRVFDPGCIRAQKRHERVA